MPKDVVYHFRITVSCPAVESEDDPDFYTERALTSPEGLVEAVKTMESHLKRITGEVTVELQSWTVRES